MSELTALILAISAGAALMIAARRWNNTDPDAGGAIAGFALFAMVIALIASTA